MKVTLMPGIESISGSMKGAMGKRTVFMTRTKPDGKKETHMYLRSKDDYKRKTPVSEHEKEVRDLFSFRHALVLEIMAEYKSRGETISKKDAWDRAKRVVPNV